METETEKGGRDVDMSIGGSVEIYEITRAAKCRIKTTTAKQKIEWWRCLTVGRGGLLCLDTVGHTRRPRVDHALALTARSTVSIERRGR